MYSALTFSIVDSGGSTCETGTVTTSEGDELAFYTCLLATGGRVRTLDVPGSDLDGVHYLRTMREAVDIALRRFVQSGRQKRLLDLHGTGGVRKDYDYKSARSGG